MAAEDRASRLLVVAAEAIRGEQVLNAISERVRDGAEVRVMAPALTETALENAMGDVDDAIAAARERLRRSEEALGGAGIDASGEVGDSDLKLAIEDALRTFPADEILIVAHDEGGPYLERRGIAEAERSFRTPITEVYVERDGGEAKVAAVEHVDGGARAAEPGEAEPRSRNLPAFSPRDVLGIVVAIVGTIVLVVLAAGCEETRNTEGGFGGEAGGGFTDCSAALLIAGALGLANLAHVVGLALFQTGGYRGVWQAFFARLSLYGTPVAIIATILLVA